MHAVATLTISALVLAVSGSPWTAQAKTAACAWDHPGHDAFIGDLTQAVDHYRDIASHEREQLKARMARHDYDDIVVITRDSIEGRQSYGPQITGMHFGAGHLCGAVTREAWDAQHRETGLVYCAGSQCVLVPAVCRNVSRIVPRSGGAPGHPGSPPEELVFEPPGAINPPAAVPALPPGAALTPPPVDRPPSLTPPLSPPPVFGAPPDAPPPLLVDGPPEAPPSLMTPPPEVFWPPWWPPESSPPGAAVPPWASVPITPVPEPRTWMLLMLGIAALAFWFTRRR